MGPVDTAATSVNLEVFRSPRDKLMPKGARLAGGVMFRGTLRAEGWRGEMGTDIRLRCQLKKNLENISGIQRDAGKNLYIDPKI